MVIDTYCSSGGASNSESRSALDISKSVLSDGQAFSNFINYAYEIVEASFVEATIWSGSASDRKSCLSCCASSVQFNHHISYLQGKDHANVCYMPRTEFKGGGGEETCPPNFWTGDTQYLLSVPMFCDRKM